MSSEIYRNTLDSLIKEKYTVEYVEKFAGGLDCSFFQNAIQVEAIRAAIRDFQATPKKAFWICLHNNYTGELRKKRGLKKNVVLFEREIAGEIFTFAVHQSECQKEKITLSEVRTGMMVVSMPRPRLKKDWLSIGESALSSILDRVGEQRIHDSIKRQM